MGSFKNNAGSILDGYIEIKKRTIVWSLISLLTFSVGFVMSRFIYQEDNNEKQEGASETKPENELDDTIEKLDAETDFIDLNPFFDFVPNGIDTPQQIFKVDFKDHQGNNSIYFGKCEYVLYEKSVMKNLHNSISSLCSVSKEVRPSLLGSLKRMFDPVETSIGYSITKGLYGEIKHGEKILLELFYVLNEIMENRKVRIFIQGYADGQNKDWDEDLGSDFIEEKISYYSFNIDENGRIVVSDSVQEHELNSSKYYNKDLPFLRAFYIKRLMSRILAISCKKYQDRIDINIIEGKEYVNRKNTPSLRRADLIVCVY